MCRRYVPKKAKTKRKKKKKETGGPWRLNVRGSRDGWGKSPITGKAGEHSKVKGRGSGKPVSMCGDLQGRVGDDCKRVGAFHSPAHEASHGDGQQR